MEWWEIVLLFLAMNVLTVGLIYFFHMWGKRINKENTTYSEDNDND